MLTSTQSALKRDEVLFVERSGELLFHARLRDWSPGAEGKPSLNRANEV